MARVERKHQVLSEPLTEDLLHAKATEGWRPIGVVWERTVEGEAPEDSLEAVPFGLRVAADCCSLEPDGDEIQTMIRMLKGIVDENSFSTIAEGLNAGGSRTRSGAEWNQTMVFHMLPRLIEVAPTIYSSADWAAMRPKLQKPQ